MPNPLTATVVVDPYLSGKRIDHFLIRHFRNYTPYRMQRIVRAGHVAIEGTRADDESRVYKGQNVTVRLIEPPDKLFEPQEVPIEILDEDEWLIVVNKQAGQIAHPAGTFHDQTLANGLQNHLDQQSGVKGLLRPGIVHRLDRLTSGVLLVAKDHLTHRRLAMQFQEHCVAKTYLAIVHNRPQPAEGSINIPIGLIDTQDGKRVSIAEHARQKKQARTDYRTLEHLGEYSLIEATPRTGRLHQIRVHLATIGCPIVADEYYGRTTANTVDETSFIRQTELIHRHALHAASLSLVHPRTEQHRTWQAPIPTEIANALDRLRFELQATAGWPIRETRFQSRR